MGYVCMATNADNNKKETIDNNQAVYIDMHHMFFFYNFLAAVQIILQGI